MNEKLRELRREHNLMQKELAEKLGITTQAYSHYETGRRFMSYDLLQKTADFFGVSVDYLLSRTERVALSPFENPSIDMLALMKFSQNVKDNAVWLTDLSEEERQQVRDFVEFLRNKKK